MPDTIVQTPTERPNGNTLFSQGQVSVAEGTLLRVPVVEGGQPLLISQLTIIRQIVNSPQRIVALLKELAVAVDELRQDARENIVTENTKHLSKPYKTTKIVNAGSCWNC
jgi:hypothetical protein